MERKSKFGGFRQAIIDAMAPSLEHEGKTPMTIIGPGWQCPVRHVSCVPRVGEYMRIEPEPEQDEEFCHHEVLGVVWWDGRDHGLSVAVHVSKARQHPRNSWRS